jgi:ribosomal protein S25
MKINTRRNEMEKRYLVKKWNKEKPNSDPEMKIVNDKEVFEVVSKASEDEEYISIYEIGDCVLDWS